MREIAQAVREGAMAYLRQQYKVVGVVFAVLCVIFLVMAFGLNAQNKVVPFAFLTGGFLLRALWFSRHEDRNERIGSHNKRSDGGT